ncbi:class I SAM-dependent methyltransferase [Phycicoccus sonneratiae]|uniref:Class I SAM-dependent methyltransferase n=1 Tax=Phycicoccus sonneratiae TaxID=2807628 RepID=A0ABS2CQW4_9MICO|nr:methyltransferase domain-containing protein [Phycicoccus sonneraticus]MBM6402274.1 class I SAM-dependent methyltransferase [Phycicoccus sonneraticus]
MSLDAGAAAVTFGRGGDEPYHHALSTGGPLHLFEHGSAAGASTTPQRVPVHRFLAGADRTERRLLASTRGSVLDVGCGPGRMVAEARRRGRDALGVDVSPTSVRLAADRGIPVHLGSVFGPLPAEGSWDVLLLLDGNVGIGGDPSTLLHRCRDVASPAGLLVIETSPERGRLARYTAQVSTADGRPSDPFPWAEVGADALVSPARDAGWHRLREVRRRRRTFVVLGVGVRS